MKMEKFYKVMIYLLLFGGALNSYANYLQSEEIKKLKATQAAQAAAVIGMADLLREVIEENREDSVSPPSPLFNPDSIPLTEETSKISA